MTECSDTNTPVCPGDGTCWKLKEEMRELVDALRPFADNVGRRGRIRMNELRALQLVEKYEDTRS